MFRVALIIGIVVTSCSGESQSGSGPSTEPQTTTSTTSRTEPETTRPTSEPVDVPLLAGAHWVRNVADGLVADNGHVIYSVGGAIPAGTSVIRAQDGTVYVARGGAVLAFAPDVSEPEIVLNREASELSRLPDGTVIARYEGGTIDLETGDLVNDDAAPPSERIIAANGLAAEHTTGIFETDELGHVTRVIQPDGVRLLDERGEQSSRWELGGPLESHVTLIDFDGRFILASRGLHEPDPDMRRHHFVLDVLGGTFEHFDAIPGTVALATADDPELPNVRWGGGIEACPTWSSTPPKLAAADLPEPVAYAFDNVMLGIIRCDDRFMSAAGAPIDWDDTRAWRSLAESLMGAAEVNGTTHNWNTVLGASITIASDGSVAVAVDPDPSFELYIIRDDSHLGVWGSVGPESADGIRAAAEWATDRLGLRYYDWGLATDGPELNDLARQGIEEFIGTSIGGAADMTAIDVYVTDEQFVAWARALPARPSVLGELSRPLIEEAGIEIIEWIDNDEVSAEESAMFESLRRFASDGRLDGINWSPEVVLAAGPIPAAILTSDQLADPNNWSLDVGYFRAGDGPVSALSMLTRGTWAEPVVGPHPHCASGPMRAPAVLSGLRRVSIQRTDIDSCLAWGTVDLFFDNEGRVAGVSLDFWEP
ncbi:MAG: hypothetical protein ACR2NL_06530 [Acidimicrobiia bacterium]